MRNLQDETNAQFLICLPFIQWEIIVKFVYSWQFEEYLHFKPLFPVFDISPFFSMHSPKTKPGS